MTDRADYPYGEMDASKWAAEFKRLFPESDEGLMLGWFANAIMTGYDNQAAAVLAAAQSTTPDRADLCTCHLRYSDCRLHRLATPDRADLAEAYDQGHSDGTQTHDDVGYCQHDGRKYAESLATPDRADR